jgi:hypothetical protein
MTTSRRGALALALIGMLLAGVAASAAPDATASIPPPLATTDADKLALSLSWQDCIGVVVVLKRTIDSGSGGEYTEFLDVRPLRWFTGTCVTKKLRLYALPHTSSGFLSTGTWEVGARDTVVVVAYHEKGRAFVSQTPHTLWHGLAPATPERIQFLEANVPRLLENPPQPAPAPREH